MRHVEYYGELMFFVVLAKMKAEITAEFMEATKKAMENPPPNVKVHDIFWTLGQYDFVVIYEAPSEKEALKMAAFWAKFEKTQTLVALPQKEAMKLFQ